MSATTAYAGKTVISGDHLFGLRGDCIYILWRNQECLYVGVSTAGLSRPLSPSHHRIGKEIRKGDDMLVLWFEDGAGILTEIEAWLIYLLKPTLNRDGTRRKPRPVAGLWQRKA